MEEEARSHVKKYIERVRWNVSPFQEKLMFRLLNRLPHQQQDSLTTAGIVVVGSYRLKEFYSRYVAIVNYGYEYAQQFKDHIETKESYRFSPRRRLEATTDWVLNDSFPSALKLGFFKRRKISSIVKEFVQKDLELKDIESFIQNNKDLTYVCVKPEYNGYCLALRKTWETEPKQIAEAPSFALDPPYYGAYPEYNGEIAEQNGLYLIGEGSFSRTGGFEHSKIIAITSSKEEQKEKVKEIVYLIAQEKAKRVRGIVIELP